MFTYIPTNSSYTARGALEIAIRSRETEKKLALMNAVSVAENPDQPKSQTKSKTNPFRSLVVSFFALMR